MSSYSDFFLKSSGSVAEIECVEIAHPNFTRTYRVVMNYTSGCSVRHENGTVYAYDYYPLSITHGGNRADLDQKMQVTVGDLGEILPTEIDAVIDAGGMNIKPTMTYRTCRSDDLNTILFGPAVYEIPNLSSVAEGSTFEAQAPSLNLNKTGEIYALDRFPMLRGFL